MKIYYLIYFLIFFVILCDQASSIRWLSLQHSRLEWNLTSFAENDPRNIRSSFRSPCSLARRKFGLTKLQAKLCRNYLRAMPHVQKAANLAAETCQTIFQDRRWNCSSITTAPYLTPDLTRATREQAYVYAISSSALIHTLARACASGTLYHCTCASRPNVPHNNNFHWGGCGDNIQWGVNFVKRFIDNVEKADVAKTRKRRRNFEERKNILSKEDIAAVNLHNSRIGRKITVDSLQTQCKCHGVSGSCNIKTCWKGLPPMAEIGRRLLIHYTNAKEVSRQYIEGDLGKKRISELFYLSKSPDYCTRDKKLGSFGTVGRKCNVTTDGTNSCRRLCCGRGYRTIIEEKLERCQCKYYNCCYVKCNICRTKTQIYECG